MEKPLPRKPGMPPPPDPGAVRAEGWRIIWIISVVSAGAVLAEIAGTTILKQYGVGIFLAVPLCMGIACAVLYNRGKKWSWMPTMGVTSATFLVAGFLSLIFNLEGAFCLLLAGPLIFAGALVGLFIGWLAGGCNKSTLLMMCMTAPFTMGFEYAAKPLPPLLEQSTTIEVNAPPDVVWRYVPAFPKIETLPTGLLALDMAYPVASEMTGTGVGAARSCVLSTGVMPETVTVWEPGRRLEFEVLATPPAMTETNPFGHAETAHVEGYFQVKRGRFVLTALPDGRTRIEGTSWFEHALWPQSYWAPLTRQVVKEVHLRVFEHIKQLAEKDMQPAIPGE